MVDNESAVNKTNSMFGMICRSFQHLGADILIHLYKSIVRANLEY